MKLRYYMISLATATLLLANPLSVEKIVVNDTQTDNDQLVGDANSTAKNTAQHFVQKSLSTLSTQANMNPYTVVQFSPSVNFTPVDSTGSNENSYHDPIRIRGKAQSGPGGVYMINGMPVSSNPGGGKEMLDMENISSIDLYKGYLDVDKNLGFSSLIGKVDMNVLPPSSKMGANISQSFGSDNFKRTFIRVDSGKIGDFKLFGSFSSLSSDKTKGAGDQHRLNGMLGIEYTPNESLDAKLYLIRNADQHDNYMALTYAQAKDLGNNFNLDFASTKPTGSNNNNYFAWNKQNFDTTLVMAEITYKPTDSDKVVFKPYYKKDIGDYWYSNSKNGTNMVVDWSMDHDLYGGVAEYEHIFDEVFKAKVGYWYNKQLPPGPPSDQKKYTVNSSGNLQFAGYAILAKNDYHTIESPFLELSGDISDFHYAAGLQDQIFTVGSIKSYTNNTSVSTSLDYDTAIANTAIDPNASVGAKTFHNLLPSLYLGYDVTKNSTVYVDYSRTYGFDVNLFPTYVSNESTFTSNGVTLQKLWDDLKLETSDNIDLGIKTTVGAITLNPNAFVSFVKNKQANIYDTALHVNYPANVGDALGYGAEFSAYGPITENLEFLAGLSYNKYMFTQNFASSSTTTVDIKGNQLPDAPEVMAKAALSYSLNRWMITPSARYTSSRYGDVANTQKIDAFTLVDLDISYKGNSLMGSKSTLFRVTATNVTNEKYIASIITADNALATTGTSSTYQTGAPFGLYGSINLKY